MSTQELLYCSGQYALKGKITVMLKIKKCSKSFVTYRKVARCMLWLVAHPRIFRLLMKEKFEVYVSFGQKGPKLSSILVYCFQLYGTLSMKKKPFNKDMSVGL